MSFEPSRLTAYTADAIVAEIRRVITEHFGGQPPKQSQFNKYSRVRSGTIYRRFGTWETAIRAAGYDYSRSRIPIAALRKDLKRMLDVADGKFFTCDFYVHNGGRFSPKTLKSRLGYPTWERMLQEECGVRRVRRVIAKKKRPDPPSKKQLLVELKRVCTLFGRRPTYGEFKAHGEIGTKVYERVFEVDPKNWTA